MSLSLLLGAGFSKWAADLPVASQLFDFQIDAFGPRESNKLQSIKCLKQTWDESHEEGLSEQFITDALNFPEKDKQLVLWYIVRRLSEPFIWQEYHAQRFRRQTIMIDENRKRDIPGVIKAQNFFDSIINSSIGGIITTNYDMLVEYAFGTNRFNYGIPNQILLGRGPYPLSNWKNPVRLTGRMPLAKIHGSVSWDEDNYYTDGRGGITGNALIVAPLPEKQIPNSLQIPLNLSKNILQKSNRLIVFGFAFNPYDNAVLNLLRVEGKNINSVLLINIEPQDEIAKELWPHARITSILPPPDGLLSLQEWKNEG